MWLKSFDFLRVPLSLAGMFLCGIAGGSFGVYDCLVQLLICLVGVWKDQRTQSKLIFIIQARYCGRGKRTHERVQRILFNLVEENRYILKLQAYKFCRRTRHVSCN